MTTTSTTEVTTAQTFRGTMVPMFMPSNMEQPMAEQATTQIEDQEVSLLDVKELYDLAYEQKGSNEENFKKILAEAVKMDLAYRRQLSKEATYKDPTKKQNFANASEGAKVA